MITLLIVFILGVPLVTSVLTYTLYCYEESNQSGTPLGQLLPNVLRTAIKSYVYECVILALHPLGLWPDLWTRPKAGQPIVVLVHGLFHNQSAWVLFRHWFQNQGYTVACFSYPSWRTDLEAVESSLKSYLEQILTHYPDQPIHLVGHSLGGLLLRGTLSQLPNVKSIKTLTTLGTPYQGSKLAPFALNSLGHILRFQGEAVQKIARRPFPAPVPLLAITVPTDNMVLPNSALHCDQLPCTQKTSMPISHVAMLYSKEIFFLVAHWIKSAPKQ